MECRYDACVQDMLISDRRYIWHPYSSMGGETTILPVLRASGCKITLADVYETQLIDGMSSWWCMIHGYNNAKINAALKRQIDEVSHVMFGGLTHSPAVQLAKNLLQFIGQPELDSVFFADSGSVAVEVSLKMALQYQISLNCSTKTKFICVKRGYHGDTIGAMSACDPISSMHSLYGNYVPKNIFVSAPPMVDTLCTSNLHAALNLEDNYHEADNEKALQDMEKAMKNHHEEICAVILEPLLQGAGGMRLYHPKYLIEVKKLCLSYDIPLIMDEIATGFGRTGQPFAFRHCEIYQEMMRIPDTNRVKVFPDILCVGKGLTGGYMTMSAVVTTNRISSTISSKSTPTGGVFMHGPTFMANPLACAAANASLDILNDASWQASVKRIELQLYNEIYSELKRNDMYGKGIKGLRIVGAVAIIELFYPVDGEFFQRRQVEKGIFIRPFGRLIYIMPPYIISTEELTVLTSGVKELLQEWFAQQKLD